MAARSVRPDAALEIHNELELMMSGIFDGASDGMEPMADLDALLARCAGDPEPSGEETETSEMLRANLAALGVHHPGESELIRTSPARLDLEWIETPEGLSAVLGGSALGSKRYPKREADKLASTIDPEQAAIVAVNGFGLGYHCRSLLDRLGDYSMLVCYEPDVAMLRAVLSRVDCVDLLSNGRFRLVCDEGDRARLASLLVGNEALVGMGVQIIDHPPSRARIGGRGEAFGRAFSEALGAARTHVVTTLANSRVSFRNGLMNLEHVIRSAGIKPMEGSCRGKPAIVVSAGPSLARNLELLDDPSVRDSFVIIAVQTVLKTLLARGIRPHFVAALDYHEVSKRFYEGLSAEDVRGIRLIAEPKANPAILDSFPGEVLCPRDELIDTLLGDGLARDMGTLNAGATVAHLCYYFARYLGCDPVIFVGQDLGFSDGQYYADGAAIHSVWGAELGAHRTLEMFEWERIVRMRAHLLKREDIHGRGIYCDAQMSSYLAQFERDFAEDQRRGLRVIDASEGGVRKQHAEVMTLHDAIDRFGGAGAEHGRMVSTDRARVIEEEPVVDRIELVAEQCRRIASLSDVSITKLRMMLELQGDQRRVSALIGEVNTIRDEVMGMRDAFSLVEFVNQIAVLNRMKRDRVIGLRSKDADAIERQRLQIERDISNVEWTRDAAISVAEQLGQSVRVLRGQEPKQTNENHEARDEYQHSMESGARREVVHAIVLADPQLGGLGTRRTLEARVLPEKHGGHNVLQTTIARLDRCTSLDGITLLSPDAQRTRELLGSLPSRLKIEVVGVDPATMREQTARIGSARVASSSSWRGSLGMLCCYDESVHPGMIADVMKQRGIDACAIVGGDWAMVDPAIVDEAVERVRNQNKEKRLGFSQAGVGLGAMVLDRPAMEALGSSMWSGTKRNHFATLGSLVSYLPQAPQADPIVRGVCVQVEPAVRDSGLRFVADSIGRLEAIRSAYAMLDDPLVSNAGQCVEAMRASSRVRCPGTIILETCTGRLLGGDWGMWKRGSLEAIERQALTMNDAHTLLKQIGSLREDAALIFDGVGDPLMHPEAMGLVSMAKEDGIASVEIRSDMLREGLGAEDLIDSGLDVLMVDVIAQSAKQYRQLTGVDGYGRVCDRVQSLLDEIAMDRSASLWVGGRMIRCETLLDEIESFYDTWLMLTGCALIEPLPGFVRGQRVSALTVPGWRKRQIERETMRIRCDGVVVDARGRAIMAQGSAVNAFDEGIERAHQRVRGAARATELEMKMNAKEPAA